MFGAPRARMHNARMRHAGSCSRHTSKVEHVRDLTCVKDLIARGKGPDLNNPQHQEQEYRIQQAEQEAGLEQPQHHNNQRFVRLRQAVLARLIKSTAGAVSWEALARSEVVTEP